MDATIDHRPASGLLTVDLETGASVRAQAGAMVGMDDGRSVETGAGVGLLGSLKRSVLGGESVFQHTFVAEGLGPEFEGPGRMWLLSRSQDAFLSSLVPRLPGGQQDT